MGKCIIFGAGTIGKRTCYKLNNEIENKMRRFEVTAYTDNDQKLWGTKINGVPVISPEELKKQKNILVIICSDYFKEILEQLEVMGIQNIAIVEPTGNMLYLYSKEEKMMPIKFSHSPVVNCGKGTARLRSILFVQQIPCIRTHKIASILKEKGIRVSLAYTAEHPKRTHSEFVSQYDGIHAIYSMEELVEFVNQSDFDLIHSSNEPDSLTNLLLLSNKKVIHDTHDMMSLCRDVDMDALALEYVANVKGDGNIYISEYARKIALRKFSISQDKTFILENMPLRSYQPSKYLPKLSALDGEIHCVYEGGISPNPYFYRYFEEIWLKIANKGIHIHFYSTQDETYCKKLENMNPYFHYEGCLETSDLITQMTQYDCGLLLFNITEEFRVHLEVSLANKIFDYLYAGIPEVVNIQGVNREFIENYKIGGYLDLEGDIKSRIQEISSIQIDRDFCHKNKLMMETKAEDLIEFYNRIINS